MTWWVPSAEGLTALVPPLVILIWPMMSITFARAFSLASAAKLADSFARLAAGVLLAILAGIGTAFLLGLACVSGASFWSRR